MRRCGGDEENMLYYVTYYCDDERERQLTNLYNRLSKKSWKAFKREATIQFEGSAAKGRRYMLEMVEELVANAGLRGSRRETTLSSIRGTLRHSRTS